jgi:exopolysaccharide production protein ExoQ
MLRLKSFTEKAFVIVAFFLSTAAVIPILLETEDSSASQLADPFTPILFAGVYAITLLLSIARRKSVLRIAAKDIFVWLLVGLALASIYWTMSPELTQRRSVLLLGSTVFGAYVSTRYNIKEQLHLLAWTFGIIIILSFVFAIALPSYGLMTFQEGGVHEGAWRGILSHKNMLGRLMSLSSVVFLLLANDNSQSEQRYRWFVWGGFVLSVALVVLSTSKTALIICITMTLIQPLYKALRGKYTTIVPILITLVLVCGGAATLLLDNLEVIASALGKDLTLTGRTDIWAVMFELIWQRPLFGYGYNGFWLGWDGEVSAYIWRTLAWECPYAHNGFMDLLAELGFTGLILFLLSFTYTCTKAIKLVRKSKTIDGLWPLLYLTYLIMYNITESTLLSSNNIYWIIYTLVVFSTVVEYEIVRFDYANTVLDEEWLNVKASHE